MGNNKIEKVEDAKLGAVSGGFIGKDWTQRYARVYERFGIVHTRNKFDFDEYRFSGKLLPKDYVYYMADKYLDKNTTESEREEIANEFTKLKNSIAQEDYTLIDSIW
ncbi:MAG: hypothetical protein IKE05_03525, partial [Clostridia bacterium]|nr:hypothetical protein [Clostridia bacterium]